MSDGNIATAGMPTRAPSGHGIHTVIATLDARVEAIEAGRSVEHLGIELARAFVELAPEEFVTAIQVALANLQRACTLTGLNPAPFRCGEEVEAEALREFGRLRTAKVSETEYWRN